MMDIQRLVPAASLVALALCACADTRHADHDAAAPATETGTEDVGSTTVGSDANDGGGTVAEDDSGDHDSDGDDAPPEADCSPIAPVTVAASAPEPYACQAEHPATNTLDGNADTRSSCEGVGSALTYDFGSVRSLCSVGIAWHHGDERTNDFLLQTSEDGTTFTDVGETRTSDQTSDVQAYGIGRLARAVRIVFLGNSTPDNEWMSITQVEFSGEGDGRPEEPGSCNPRVLLFNETFESANVWAGVHQQFGTAHAFNVVTDPVYAGEHSGRFELRYGDPVTSNGIRSEVLFPLQDGRELWYGFKAYYPSDGFQDDANNDILSQWHQGSGSGSPTSTFRVMDGRFYMRIGSSASNPDNRVWYELGPHTKDTWHEFVFHFVHSGDDDGLVEVWHNGVQVLAVYGGNMNPVFSMPRWKVGIYKSTWGHSPTDTDTRIFFVDDVRMADETATYDDMANCR